ncbi:hypothetical protein [Saccharothrix saharensis]|uniref:hypothetical protein n=1 Tax=Saccharothrix saharensis TaxID=571190 RepID=UPI0014784B9A|nr:hypothetical protein [Saccharothrix saharensis]
MTGVEGDPADFHPPASWHLGALRAAGSDEVAVRWRRDDTVLVVARRHLWGCGCPADG